MKNGRKAGQHSAESGIQYRLFQVALAIKGFDGAVELIAGIALLAVGPHRINHVIDSLIHRLLENSPDSFLLKLFTHNGTTRHVGPVHFAVLYLLVNGIVKIAIVAALMKRKVRVFPYAMAFLGLFVIYGLIRLTGHPSLPLACAMALNIVVLGLIWREYVALKAEHATPGQA